MSGYVKLGQVSLDYVSLRQDRSFVVSIISGTYRFIKFRSGMCMLFYVKS